jgi:hypothetical protein
MDILLIKKKQSLFANILQSVGMSNNQNFSVCISIQYLNNVTNFDEIWFQCCEVYYLVTNLCYRCVPVRTQCADS